MTSDELGRVAKLDAASPRQRREYGNRMRHDRRLGVFRQLELVLRPLAHQLDQILPKRLINLGEHIVRRAARLRESCAHADGLAALPGKKECAHPYPRWAVLYRARGR